MGKETGKKKMMTRTENYRRAIEFKGPEYLPYIGGTSHSVMPETPLDNVIAMYEAFLEHQPAPSNAKKPRP